MAGGADVPIVGEAVVELAPDLPVGSLDGYAIVDRVEPGRRTWFRLPDLQGDLRIDALSYSLFSPVTVQLTLHTEEGQVVTQGIRLLVDDGPDRFQLWDGRLEATDLPWGDYTLEVRAITLPEQLYPNRSLHLDATPFVVLSLTRGDELPAPIDVDCRTPEDFPTYLSPEGGPLTKEAPQEQGCGVGGQAIPAALLFGLVGGLRRRRDG